MLALAAFIIARQPAHEHSGSEAKSAMAMDAEPFSDARLGELRAAGRPVFVDATAAWCITCKLNEHLALRDAAVVGAFHDRHVALLVADWTNRDDAITAYLATFGRNGVPLYVFYPSQGAPIVLPQLLTPSLVLDRTGLHQD
ncbi:MAG: thioredoxin family protein [Alphaproteobacteria bacterium]